MKWEDLHLTEIELNKRAMLECENEKPCGVCGSPTKYIDYCFEARMCSEECQKALDDDYFSWLKKMDEIPIE